MSSVLRLVSSAAVILALVGATRGYAAPITVDLSSPDTVLTFNEIVLAPSTLMTTQYQALGVTFGPGIYYDPVNLPNSGNFFVPEGLSGHALGNFNDLQGQTATSSIRILFTSPVSEAALRWAGNQQGPFTGTALLGGLLVESAQFSPVSSGFVAKATVGFTGILFDELTLSNFTFPSSRFDLLQFSVPDSTSAPVPEPVSLLLVGGGLAALAAVRRRARRRR